MRGKYILLCITLLGIILFVKHLFAVHSQRSLPENTRRQIGDSRLNLKAPVEDYNQKVSNLHIPLKLVPGLERLDLLYWNNTKNLFKKFIQMRDICKSLSSKEILKYHQFCDSLHFNFSKRVPQAIIIGAAKAGTTLLKQLLNEHPFISISLAELNFFDNNLWQDLGDHLKNYSGLMPESLPNQVTMEKSPGYMYIPYVPERVSSLMGDNIKFIVLYRDPIQRTMSMQRYLRTDINKVYKKSIKKANRYDRDRYVFYQIKDGPILVNEDSFIYSSRYIESLSNWLQFYSLEHFHFTAFEDFSRKPLEVIKGIEEFLGVPSWFDEDAFYIDNDGRLCYKKTELAESRDVDILRTMLETNSLHITTSYTCDGGVGIYEHFIKEEYKNVLEDYFRPYNERLYDMIGINFGW